MRFKEVLLELPGLTLEQRQLLIRRALGQPALAIISIAQHCSEFGEAGEDEVGDVGGGGFGGGSFAGEDEDAHGPGAAGHFHVGVKAVADHRELRGLELVAVKDAAQHAGIGLAHDGGRRAAGGSLEHGADGAAINEHGRLVRGTNAVGVGRYIGLAAVDPPGGAAESRIAERGVEADDDGIGLFGGIVRKQFETGGGEFGAHAGCAEDEQASNTWTKGKEIFDGGLNGGIKSIGGGLESERVEMLEIVIAALGRVVGQKSVADAEFSEEREERVGGGQKRSAIIDGAVEVKGDVTDALQFAMQVGFQVNRRKS